MDMQNPRRGDGTGCEIHRADEVSEPTSTTRNNQPATLESLALPDVSNLGLEHPQNRKDSEGAELIWLYEHGPHPARSSSACFCHSYGQQYRSSPSDRH